MVNFFQAVILSIVQGITEWFPISSSGHLEIAQKLLGIQDIGFVVYLHFASVLAVIILFWHDIIDIFAKKDYKYILTLIIATIPVAIVGLLLKDYIEYAFGNLFFMGIFFIIFGTYIYFTKNARVTKKKATKLDSLVIGISQVFSLFPGVSRSGMAMGTGLAIGLKKSEAIKFSFLIAIPIIFGASLVEARSIAASNISLLTFFTSFTITLFISLMTINLLIKMINTNKFYLFGVYNIILGIILVLYRLF